MLEDNLDSFPVWTTDMPGSVHHAGAGWEWEVCVPVSLPRMIPNLSLERWPVLNMVIGGGELRTLWVHAVPSSAHGSQEKRGISGITCHSCPGDLSRESP